MKFSEAVLLGSIDSVQGFGSLAMYGDVRGRCVLNTALHGIGVSECRDAYGRVIAEWPFLDEPARKCPACGYPTCPLNSDGSSQLYMILYHLNDFHEWPRPQIAEWVKQFEPVEEQPTTKEDVCDSVTQSV